MLSPTGWSRRCGGLAVWYGVVFSGFSPSRACGGWLALVSWPYPVSYLQTLLQLFAEARCRCGHSRIGEERTCSRVRAEEGM